MSQDPFVAQIGLTHGLLVEASDHLSGEVTYDVNFPAEEGTSRLLSNVLADLAEDCLRNDTYVEVSVSITVRKGLQVQQGLNVHEDEPAPV